MHPVDHGHPQSDSRLYSITLSSELTLTRQIPPAYTYGQNPGPSHSDNPSLFSIPSSDGMRSEGEDEGKEGEGFEAGYQDGNSRRTESTKSEARSDDTKPSPQKRPRITLARGGACVPCRNRKLKCSGSRPCDNCEKGGLECRYEEIRRRKPRQVMLEERIDQLEGLLLSSGVSVPPSQLRGGPAASSLSVSPTSNSFAYATPDPLASAYALGPTGFLSSPAHAASGGLTLANIGAVEVGPHSPLEMGLITFVLPYTPHLSMPLHPERFVSLLYLPPTDPHRPHPALLYLLFAEAARLLEQGTPAPHPPPLPSSVFPTRSPPSMPAPTVDPASLLQCFRNTSVALFERARSELDWGIRAADRPFDLARAAVGIARYLYSTGRFVEAWSLPVAQLHVLCGTHRSRGHAEAASPGGLLHTIPPHDLSPLVSSISQSSTTTSAMTPSGFPTLITPSPGHGIPVDEVETGERISAFWAAKAQQWTAGIARGLTSSMPDENCTTPWPRGTGSVDLGSPTTGHFTLADLHNPGSEMQSSPHPETTFVLALKSLGLLYRAVSLFDLPLSTGQGVHSRPKAIPPLATIQSVERATQVFRLRLPLPFHDIPPASQPTATPPIKQEYDGFNDPWWIMLHANLYTTELLLYKEMGHYQKEGYDIAVSCARALVGLVQRVKPDQWVHVDIVVVYTISFVARFLNKESQRLIAIGRAAGAKMAADEAELLRVVLARDISQHLPMAQMHAVSIQRAKGGSEEGLPP